MAPRDEQEWESRRQQIMDGALRVFSRKGFEKATNRDIAQAAGIGSPGLIYHYFKDKRDLFQSLLEERVPALQLLFHSETLMDLPPREALTRFGSTFIATVSDGEFLAVFRLLLGEAMRRPQVAEMMNQIGPLRALDFLQRYLAHQMELGALRRMDPRVAARCFVGPLIAYMLTREVFVQPDAQALTPAAMVASAIDVFLLGMEPSTEEVAAAAGVPGSEGEA